MLVWVMGGLRQGWYMTIWLRKESPVTLETLRSGARFEHSIALEALPGKLSLCDYVMMDCHWF